MQGLATAIVALTTLYFFSGAIKQAFAYLVWRYKLRSLPTLPQRAYPGVGHLYLFPKDVYRVYFKWMNIMLDGARSVRESAVLFWLGPVPVYFILNPKGAETLLKSNSLIEKPSTYRNSLQWLRDGLVLSKGQKWFQRRRLITPSFHFKILDDFLHVMNEQTDVFVDKLLVCLDAQDGAAAGGDGVVVDMINMITLCTLDIICETAMGVKIKAQANKDHYYVQALERFVVVVAVAVLVVI